MYQMTWMIPPAHLPHALPRGGGGGEAAGGDVHVLRHKTALAGPGPGPHHPGVAVSLGGAGEQAGHGGRIAGVNTPI